MDMLLGEGPAASHEKAGLAAAMAASVEFIPADAGRMLVVRAGGSDAAEAAALASSVAAELVDNPAAWLPLLPEEELAGLAAAAESARKAFEQYSAGIDSEARATAERALVDERLLHKEIELLKARVAELDGQLREASSMTPADVLQQSLPDRLEFTALEYHRQRHVEAKLAFDQLSRKLGARHPHLLAARDGLASAKADIEAELAKLIKSLKAQKADASRQLAELERRQSSVPPEGRAVRERLETLEAAARGAEDRYRQARSEGEAESAASPVSLSLVRPAKEEQAIATGWTHSGAMAAGALLGGSIPLMLFLARRRSGRVVQAMPANAEDGLPSRDHVRDIHWQSPEEIEASGNEPVLPASRDEPLAERIRGILYQNAVASDRTPPIPPLLASAMGGDARSDFRKDMKSGAVSSPANDRDRLEHEIWELRDQLAALRGRVERRTARGR